MINKVSPVAGIRAGTSGRREFDSKADAIVFRDALLKEYPPMGYGTSAIIIAPDEDDDGNTSYVVEYHIYSAD